ncbi:hypothetical protein CR969_01820 [Candidatus Saccharibacteria bacterium]|nr:MAG: hypothetical protein CR969_01820 [Candidatus Saccharibacteria bacterium]
MTSFILSIYRLIKVIIKELNKDKEFRFLVLFIVLLLSVSTTFFILVEHWKFIDALYFSVMTMSTVGYGDLVPTHDISKLFLMPYAFLSFGSFVAFTAKGIQITLYHSKEILSRKNGSRA